MIHILVLSVLSFFQMAAFGRSNVQVADVSSFPAAQGQSPIQSAQRGPQSVQSCTTFGVSKNNWVIRTAQGAISPNVITFDAFELNSREHLSLICTTPDGHSMLAEIKLQPRAVLFKKNRNYRGQMEPLIAGGFEFSMKHLRGSSRTTKTCQITCR